MHIRFAAGIESPRLTRESCSNKTAGIEDLPRLLGGTAALRHLRHITVQLRLLRLERWFTLASSNSVPIAIYPASSRNDHRAAKSEIQLSEPKTAARICRVQIVLWFLLVTRWPLWPGTVENGAYKPSTYSLAHVVVSYLPLLRTSSLTLH